MFESSPRPIGDYSLIPRIGTEAQEIIAEDVHTEIREMLASPECYPDPFSELILLRIGKGGPLGWDTSRLVEVEALRALYSLINLAYRHVERRTDEASK